jgi:hypothetical protein
MHTGFTLNDRLLRAAMVTVSRGPSMSGEELEATRPSIPSVTNKAVEAMAKPLPEEKAKRGRRKKANKE